MKQDKREYYKEYYSRPGVKEFRKKEAQKYYQKNKKRMDKNNIEWIKQNPERARFIRLKHEYNLTEKEFTILYNKQKGRCAICLKVEKELKKRLHVDHCHKTNKIRGLLCYSCNAAIGLFKENLSTLKNAIQYLLVTK